MATGIFRNYLQTYPEISIDSAGLHAVVGNPPADEAQLLMQNIGIDISEHRAKQIDGLLVSNSDLILTMDEAQKKEILFRFHYAYGRVHSLGKWGKFAIPDPFGDTIEAFNNCLHLIQKGFLDWKERIVK